MTGITLAGTQVTLESRADESLTATLYRAGYAMRIACKRGGCGLCRVHVDQGQISYNAHVCESVLTPEEREQGITLACRAVPTSDVTISVPEEGRLRCVAPAFTRYALREQSGAGKGAAQAGGRDWVID
ncbi:MAG: 2Fe-2S iron-sulfur cluster binding domain-containing protein [Propionibacteriaceae bacterium]|jgi:ferredoxin|nr:2Fe-2S iron-sulfur cluster binding domain-containing protein [Propionibacteriaceae bacterium]